MPVNNSIARSRKRETRTKFIEKRKIGQLIRFIEENKNIELYIDHSMSNELCITTREGMFSRIKLFTNLTPIEKQTLLSIFENYSP